MDQDGYPEDHKIELPEFDRTYFIVTTHPTQADLDRAEEQEKMVLVFVHRPVHQITTLSEGDLFADGLLQAWGIKANRRLTVYAVPRDKDLESARDAVIAELLDTSKKPWMAPAGLNRTSVKSKEE